MILYLAKYDTQVYQVLVRIKSSPCVYPVEDLWLPDYIRKEDASLRCDTPSCVLSHAASQSSNAAYLMRWRRQV